MSREDLETDFYMSFGRAHIFARLAHKGQVRKYTGEPYVNHCKQVAELVWKNGGLIPWINAALLHDVIEDTDVTDNEIEWFFGREVADLVLEVSDISKPEDGNRAKRKAIDREHLSKASKGGKTIKLADLINNAESIMKYDKDFAVVYLREMRELLPLLKDANYYLNMIAETILEGAEFDL